MGKFAIFRKKERWSTTWLGKVLILTLFIILAWLFVKNSYSFLAQNSPVNSEIMIMEGFLPDFAMQEVMKIFNEGDYKLMIITGKKVIKGATLFPYENDGQFTAAILGRLGFDRDKIRVVALEDDIRKDRTWYSALAVKNWMEQNDLMPAEINLVSLGCHCRRSRFLFEKAFHHKIEFGIIAIEDKSYYPSTWWSTSYGFKNVLEETIAWVYARFFFYPGH